MSASTHQAPPPALPAVMPEAPAADAARLLAARHLGAVPVQDRAGRLVGVVSAHDIVRVVAHRALGLRGLAVEDVMTPGSAELPSPA